MRKTIICLILALFIVTPLANALAYGTNYRYTGKPFDIDVNLYDYGQRYYNPNVGQFTQPDPVANYLNDPQKLKQLSGKELDQILANPQSLNPYSYVQDNPVKYVDPNGNFAVPIIMLAFTAWDLYEAYKTHNSTSATLGEKAFNYGALALDAVPGAGVVKGSAKIGVKAVEIVGKAAEAGKIIEKSTDIVKLVHVSDTATEIVKNGFETIKGLWVNNLSKSNLFLGEHSIMHAIYDADRMTKGGDYGKFIFEVPRAVYDKLVKEKLIDISKTYEIFIKPTAMEIITSYLKK